MAPRIGDRRKDGKVYSGENYGYQSPAQHNKLQQTGKFKLGAQALDRAGNAIPKPIRDIVAEAQRRLANPIVPSKAQALGFTGPSATDRALKAASDKTNVDQRIVNTGAAVAQSAIAGRLMKPSASPARVPANPAPRSVPAPTRAANRAPVRAPQPEAIPRQLRDRIQRNNQPYSPPTARGSGNGSFTQLTPKQQLDDMVLNQRPMGPLERRTATGPRAQYGPTEDQIKAFAAKHRLEIPDRTTAHSRVNTQFPRNPEAQARRAAKKAEQTQNRSVGAAAVGDVAGRTAPATRRLSSSKLPGTVKAGKAAPSPELTAARRSVIRPNTEQVARQASGPAHVTSDPKQLAPGNSPARQAPTSRKTKRNLKEKAQTEYADMVEKGYRAKPRTQPRGADTTNYLPNRGRVSPTDKGKAAKLAETEAQRLAKALEGKRGQARVDARNAFNRAERRTRKNIRRDAIADAQQFQRAQEAKRKTGSTKASMESMSADMARRPKVQGPRPAPTQTTGTKRVAANPTSNRATGGKFKKVNGKLAAADRLETTPKGTRVNFDNVKADATTPRTLNPSTGRPNLGKGSRGTSRSTTTPSPTRQRGSNPAESRPKASAPAPKGSVQAENAARAKRIKDAGSDQGRALRIKEEGDYAGQGLNVRTSKPGKTGGVRPVDGRGSSTPAYYKGRDSSDNLQYRGNRNQPVDPQTGRRAGSRRAGRLGQPGSSPTREPIPYSPYKRGQTSKAVNTPEQLRAQAAKRSQAAAKAKTATPTPPKRTSSRAADLKAKSKAQSASVRSTRGMTPAQVRALQNKYNRELPTSPTTHFNGEVRLQGSKYSMDPQASSLVNGSVSRTLGRSKSTRSAEASAAAKKTMKAVRGQRAKATAAVKARKPTVAKVNGRKKVIGTGLTRSIKSPKSSLTIRRKRG